MTWITINPFILDLKVLQRYRDELVVTKFFSELDTSLSNQVREQILSGDTVPYLYYSVSSSSCFYER